MIITLLFSSVLGSVFGVALGLAWGLGGVMIALCYVLGGMAGVTTALLALLSRDTRRGPRLHDPSTVKPAPQLNS